jgi:hypothetical protein
MLEIVKRIDGDAATPYRVGTISPSPRKRGEGWGEGASQRIRTRGEAPSPGLLRNPTSPRKRGEVKRLRRFNSKQ